MSADEMCGDYPAPCNCDDPETHDGAVTAAARPSVTDNARAEAWRRFPDGIDPETGEPVDDYGYPATAREAFIGGAEWAAGRTETTTATTEDAARVLDDVIQHLRKIWSTGHDEAREVIDTAEELLAQALPRLLATARTRTTRDELAKVICESRCSPQRKSWLETADAVLALLADQPTEAVSAVAEYTPTTKELRDELAEALSIEDDHPTRMADRVLDVLQRETKSLGAAIAWEQGHLDVCTGCCCDFARINPYRAGNGAR